MTFGSPVNTTSDERVMGGLAHFFGLIAALIVWATQKDKSRFLRFQALQAMAFDAVLVVASMILTMCMLPVSLAGGMALFFTTSQAAPSPDSLFPVTMAAMLWPMSMFLCIMPFALRALLIRTIAAVSVASGRDFRYPWIAARVGAFLDSGVNHSG
jgi:uncharacterized Tic20 family protein